MPNFYSDYYFNGKRAIEAADAAEAALFVASTIARRRRKSETPRHPRLLNVLPHFFGGGAIFASWIGKEVDVRVGRDRTREWRGDEVRFQVYAAPLL
jgi:hypothetical protein